MLFFADSRVEKTENGIRFCEQDILFSKYVFSEKEIIEVKLDYQYSGFGIVVAEKAAETPRKCNNFWLIHLAANDFSVIARTGLEQTVLKNNACLLAPGQGSQDITLAFTVDGSRLSADFIYFDMDSSKIEKQNLGTCRLNKSIEEYFLGIYSEKGNVLKELVFKSDAPEHWFTDIHNTMGGRIRFIRNGFCFENCDKDAEIEQGGIELSAGNYYISYEQEPVNGKCDIECFMFEEKSGMRDEFFEDEKKNLLKENVLKLEHDMVLAMKFRGSNGKVSEISIKDAPDEAFVETGNAPITLTGSYIEIDITDLARIEWTGMIKSVPRWLDQKEKCPHAVIRTAGSSISKETLNLKLEEEYDFEFDVSSRVFSVEHEGTTVDKREIRIDEDESGIRIFENINGEITSLILTGKDGTTLNVMLQKTFKKFVPAEIKGPIIVLDKAGEPLDLSASYREVVKERICQEISDSDREIRPKEKFIPGSLELYGIPEGETIDTAITERNRIFPDRVFLNLGTIEIEESELRHYRYIVVRYQSAENYSYIFTNYEREVFSPSVLLMTEKTIAAIPGACSVYGIKGEISEEYLYRIQERGMISAIDLCADKYDLLDAEDYTYSGNVIRISENMIRSGEYSSFIVDYLKMNSYSVNFNEEMCQYEVDISLEDKTGTLVYELDENGLSDSRIRTLIAPDRDKFILLAREEVTD